MDQPQEQDFKPRSYQEYLFEKTAEQNSILYLPTGTGKTYIAVLLVKHMSNDLYRFINTFLFQIIIIELFIYRKLSFVGHTIHMVKGLYLLLILWH